MDNTSSITISVSADAARSVTTPPVASWEGRYRHTVIASDTVVCIVVIGLLGAGIFLPREHDSFQFAGFASGCLVLMLGSLSLNRTWHSTILGHGAEEFRRLGRAVLAVILTFGLMGLALQMPDSRPWVFGILPAIGVLLLLERYGLRRLLHRARKGGQCMLPVLAAGSVPTLHDLIDRVTAAPYVGWRVEAACTLDGVGAHNPQGANSSSVAGVPVVGSFADLAEKVRQGGYRILAITADSYWTPQRLQRLAWELENTSTQMVVAPVLMDVAGPRLHISGVLGMPLLRVSAPVFTGARRVVKEIVDKSTSLALLTLLSPVLLLLAVAIKVHDRGPVFYRQPRVGRQGETFTIVKFRTMVVDAERIRERLLELNEAQGPLFKIRHDPRVTTVGRLLRRYSLDELPQLINVLLGHMSMVGPRPPLPAETQEYDSDVRRRLLVKPGLTGLWQVSGRSDLSWDEGVRLDLRYVEDWSLALDFMILWKTLHTVIRARGAY
ncbi:MAG: sugar transferase [Sciscionella sp.]